MHDGLRTRIACGVCGQPVGPQGKIASLEDLVAEFALSHEKEIKITTLDGAAWDGVLEHAYANILMIRTPNLRKVWIPLDKVVSITEGRGRQR